MIDTYDNLKHIDDTLNNLEHDIECIINELQLSKDEVEEYIATGNDLGVFVPNHIFPILNAIITKIEFLRFMYDEITLYDGDKNN